jgi:lipopolysaccharide transport system ATP-binding protein
MSDTVISVHNLSKRYRIGAQQPMYRTLRDQLNDKALAPFRAARHLIKANGNGSVNGHSRSANGRSDTIWALKDVSFDVERGEVVGIIGRNGAGKSTLLKILSRITEPTEGYADITGRIASLLEVGTGFHPELTGRENIFLNGSILGMRRAEIQSKFDEIVAFAEVEKFIDTAVKYYSSGMYTRLAFSVAAHLDPEILVVDEVLSVGDAGFQKKCLGKMNDVAKEGRTVFIRQSQYGRGTAAMCTYSLDRKRGRPRLWTYGHDHRRLFDHIYRNRRCQTDGLVWIGRIAWAQEVCASNVSSIPFQTWIRIRQCRQSRWRLPRSNIRFRTYGGQRFRNDFVTATAPG